MESKKVSMLQSVLLYSESFRERLEVSWEFFVHATLKGQSTNNKVIHYT